MSTASRTRWREALTRVAAVERLSPLLQPRRVPGVWGIHGRWAVRRAHRRELPEVIRPGGAATGWAVAAVGAEAVQIGKFDVEEEVRLRAFYTRAGLSVRYQGGGRRRSGIERTLAAFSQVQRHAPGLMPAVHDDGAAGGGRYLVEESVFGTHPRSARALQDLAGAVAAGLRKLHEGYGVVEEPLSTVMGDRFAERWGQAVRTYGIGADLDRRLRHLVDDDRRVEVSFGHGDLVGTNIMSLPERVMLIDWEYAGPIPIAFDVAKIHLHCADPDAAARILQDGLGRGDRHPSHYRFHEQLALAHARYIAWSSVTRERAHAAGRAEQLKGLIGQRLTAIEHALQG